MRRADIHQHFWPEALLSSLARRTALPRLREGWLELPGEPPSRVDPRDHDPDARAALAAADGLQRVLIAPSSPLGLESLPMTTGSRGLHVVADLAGGSWLCCRLLAETI